MSDDALIAQTRAAAAQVVRGHLDAAAVERAALASVAGTELADRVWSEARQAAEAGKREAARLLRERFGARDPRRGWPNILVVVALIAAAFALVLATGIREIPSDTGLSGWLGLLVAVLSAAVLLAGRAKPLSRAFIRTLAPAAVLLVITTVLLAVGGLPGALGAGIGAVVAAVAVVWIAVVRGRDAEATRDIDAALPTAYLDAGPAVRERAERVQRDLLAELGAERAAQVARVRDAVLAELADAHPEMRGRAGLPAGAVIIDHLTSAWLPDDMAGAPDS